MGNIVNVTVDDSTQTVNVTVAGGIITSSADGLFISNFLVIKGAGNVAGTIEVDDYVSGWISDTWVAGKVASIPVTGTSNLVSAVTGEAL